MALVNIVGSILKLTVGVILILLGYKVFGVGVVVNGISDIRQIGRQIDLDKTEPGEVPAQEIISGRSKAEAKAA